MPYDGLNFKAPLAAESSGAAPRRVIDDKILKLEGSVRPRDVTNQVGGRQIVDTIRIVKKGRTPAKLIKANSGPYTLLPIERLFVQVSKGENWLAGNRPAHARILDSGKLEQARLPGGRMRTAFPTTLKP